VLKSVVVVHEGSCAGHGWLLVEALGLLSPPLHLGVLIILIHSVRSELIHLISDVLIEDILLHHHLCVR